jgi:hypothetical protein
MHPVTNEHCQYVNLGFYTTPYAKNLTYPQILWIISVVLILEIHWILCKLSDFPLLVGV